MPPISPAYLLTWTLAATIAAGLGAFLGTQQQPRGGRWLGIAGALAAGMMLGVGEASLSQGMTSSPLPTLLGAGVAVVLLRVLDIISSRAPRSPSLSDSDHAARGETRASALHSAAEGVAIGAAAALDARFASVLIATFALHNVSEGAMFGAALAGAGRSRQEAVARALVARLAQPLVAVLVLILARAVDAALPWFLGASFGAMLYLIVAELLPVSYGRAGRTGIALVFSVAAGVVGLLGGGAR